MNITSNGTSYDVTELKNEWKLRRTIGAVEVDYRVSKDAAPDLAALERYVKENAELF